MQLLDTPCKPRLLGLIDAAVCPPKVEPLLKKSGAQYCSVFAGLPEENLGAASLFLVSIGDTETDWVTELDRLDLYTPCLSLIWSRVDMETLATHLQAFLFADIGDNMTAMVRFFDPRCTDAVFRVWGEKILSMFMGPIERWMYRGRHKDWQRVQNDSLTGARICRSILIRLDQADVDALTAHTEPDEILSALLQTGEIDGELPYLARLDDFMPRYGQALQWGLTEPADRFLYCQYTYLYGIGFDRHWLVNDRLVGRRLSGESFASAINQIPAAVLEEIERTRNLRTGTSN
ncbi:DUF4123 domain-containing protein [Paraburkholderia lycopersici]|uniref:DUF4123 domain-containing protein n=1 Tax=Paraburkholderia lycopersici TaxID=416944 RepID=A0A1G6Q0A2_9BURK|nr:DUF4123 domain-containing protein [Paraburkholderia lycopersici]SDC85749.1 protein of unknown function [Paraburkholderia lycopersici]